MKKSELQSLIKEEIKKVLNENAPMAYGEKEAIKMIWDDPGGKIESELKKIRGYESTVQGEPRGRVLYIYFTDKPAAIKGSRLLQHLIPGPEYNIRTEPSGYSIQLKA